MKYILTETEYQEILASKKQAHEFLTLKEQNSSLSNELKSARLAFEEYRKETKKILDLGKLFIKDRDVRIFALKEAHKLDNKKLAEQAHELLVKEAEIADLSSKVNSLTKENQTYLSQIEEMKRDCEGTSCALREAQRVSATRLDSMNRLTQEVRHLKAEHVCIAQNPGTGKVRIISVVKADTYRKFGWTVSEEFLVDRPA